MKKHVSDNRSRQLNPEDAAYHASRGASVIPQTDESGPTAPTNPSIENQRATKEGSDKR